MMKKVVFGWLAALAVTFALERAEEETENYGGIVLPLHGKKFDVFDWELCTTIAEMEPGNALVSPISVKFLLSTLYESSSGESARELEKILQVPEDKKAARTKISAVLRSLQAVSPNYVVEIGTKIFIDHSLTPKNWFQRILFLYYNAYVERINFTDHKAAANRVNSWVESVTHGHIKNLITEDNVNEAVMLLVNAVYFKGKWKNNFQPEDSFVGNFESPDGPQKISYMTQSNHFFYVRAPDINAQILRLPYEGEKYAMYLILPEKKNGLDDLMKTVNPFTLRKHIWRMEETSTEVILPKFMFQHKVDLKPVLRKLGLSKIFSSFGDMKGLSQDKKSNNLVVSNVIQKVGIEVNEEGSVASAASEMQLTNKIGIQDELFNASHPFLFFIEDESTGTVVFVGKFTHPEKQILVPTSSTTTTTQEPSVKPDATVLTRKVNPSKLHNLRQKVKAEPRQPSTMVTLKRRPNGEKE